MVHFHTSASCHCTLYITLVHFHTSSPCHCTCICTPHCDGPLSHFSLMSLHMCMYTTPWWSTFTLHSHVSACVYHITMVHFHISASWHCTCVCTPHHDGLLSHFSLMALHVCMYTTSWWSTFTLHSHVTACVTACVYHITINGPLSHFSLMSLHMCMYTTSWWSTFTLHSHVTACVYHITVNGPLSHFSLMSLHMCMYTTSWWSTFTFQPHVTAHVYVHHTMMVHFHT